MKVSLNELSKYVDINGLSPEEIANKLTFAGIEVEDIEHFASGTNLVIGKVLSCTPHPDSNHLHVCKVDIGSTILDIVCGAPNVKENEKVIVAQVGAKLPGKEINKGLIRGQESNGMLCSLLELGVDKKYLTEEQIDGIELLPEEATIGEKDVLKYLGIDDVVLDLKPLANRPDANSLYCVAREVGTLFARKVTIPETNLNNIKINEAEKFDVKINTPRCYKFCARLVNGVKICESPKWLKNILHSSGIRSINNVVDIGNYVMLLTGQPLHIYDLDKLEEKKLIVRDDFSTDFIALDKQKYFVIPGDICITSSENIECLGGVMGSLHSETTIASTNLVIEAAIFDPKSVRMTSIRLGLSSESSSRFIKGINKFNQVEALDLAASLLNVIGGLTSISKVFEDHTKEFEQTEISCTYSYINNRLGTSFEKNVINKTLRSLGFEIIDENNDNFIAKVPLYRIDVLGKTDLSEEVIRILGFDNIISTFPTTVMSIGNLSEKSTKENIISDLLVNQGFYQIVTYTLVDKIKSDILPIFNKGEVLSTINPLTDDHKFVRRNLLPSMIETVSYNARRKQKNFKLFEISDVYSKNVKSSHLCFACYGNELYQNLLIKHPFNFYTAKGVLENIMSIFGIESSRYHLEKVKRDSKYFHPGKSAYVYFGKDFAGVIGELHPTICKENDLTDQIAICELDLNKLFALKTNKIKYVSSPSLQPVERDIAIFVLKDIESSKIISTIKKTCALYNPEVNVFDIYEGENIPNNMKSVAINIVLNPIDATLTEAQISDLIQDKVVKALEVACGAKLRCE